MDDSNLEKLDTRILRTLNPAVSLGIGLSGILISIMVWIYSTFAQISYVKEQNTQLMTLIETRHKEAIEHSDQNRERMMGLLQSINDSAKRMEDRLWQMEASRKIGKGI